MLCTETLWSSLQDPMGSPESTLRTIVYRQPPPRPQPLLRFLLAPLLSNHSVMVRCRGRYCSGRQVSWIDGGLNRSLWRNFISLSTIESRRGRGRGTWQLREGPLEWMNKGESAVGFSSCRRMTGSCYKQRGVGSTKCMILRSNWDIYCDWYKTRNGCCSWA